MDELGRMSAEEFRQSAKQPVRIILENIRSMHNVGSVFRSADAFRCEGIVLCGYTPQPPHRDIHKTALGATETVDWLYLPAAAEAVQLLKGQGYKVYAAEQTEGSILLQTFSTADPVAVVFGNEVEGVSAGVIALCDGCIEIPQFGTKHSLNVSVAAALVLWELIRPSL